MKLIARITVAVTAAAVASVVTVGTASAASVSHRSPTVKVRTAAPSTVAISAFPAGGRGGGTETTCANFSTWLQTDLRNLDTAMAGDREATQMQAVVQLNQDVEDALNAGCVVIY